PNPPGERSDHAVLARVSPGYPPHGDRLLTCYAPVRRSAQPRRTVLARLACVRHAASVRPEPGSNSPKEKSDTALFNETLTSVNVRNQSTLVSLVQLRSEVVPSDSRAAQAFRKPEVSRSGATVGGQL